MAQFDYAVIGRGLTGSAAARHLSLQSRRVALIGPEEPAEKKSHRGVFASHYDEGRITRTIDPDENWARLANRAISRYRAIESQSGVAFYTETGCLISGLNFGNGARYVGNSRANAATFGLNTEDHDRGSLRDRFPYFEFEDGIGAIFEKDGAGHISPRRLVAAQARSAGLNGATLIGESVRRVRPRSDHVEIVTSGGDSITASRVVVATGGYTIMPGLLPDPIDMAVQARTVTLFDVSPAEAARLKTMPSLIFEAENAEEGIYLLPPILYPDGRHYLKIGAETPEKQLHNEQEIGDWFRSDGSDHAREFVVSQASRFVPELRIDGISTLTCVTSQTPTGYPAIGWSDSSRVAVMAGGCGSSAKSSDEIGRLGCQLLLDGSIADQGYSADFEPRFK
jgi:sarcosine oxidase